MSYIDGFIIAAPTADKAKFIDHANRMDKIFLEFGALSIVEGWGDDVKDGRRHVLGRSLRPDQGSVRP